MNYPTADEIRAAILRTIRAGLLRGGLTVNVLLGVK